jgi:hypothetical protein
LLSFTIMNVWMQECLALNTILKHQMPEFWNGDDFIGPSKSHQVRQRTFVIARHKTPHTPYTAGFLRESRTGPRKTLRKAAMTLKPAALSFTKSYNDLQKRVSNAA